MLGVSLLSTCLMALVIGSGTGLPGLALRETGWTDLWFLAKLADSPTAVYRLWRSSCGACCPSWTSA